MGAPGAEAAIYESPSKRHEVRIAVGLDVPMLTAEKSDTFSADLDTADWAFSLVNGQGVLVDSGDLVFRSYGVPPWEWARTRENWFPRDPLHPFQLEINCTWPETDPVYSPVIVVGGLRQTLGDIGEPLVIYCQGSATSEGSLAGDTREGEIRLFSSSANFHNEANDQASHEIIIEWDPLKAVNDFIFTLKFDGSVIVENDTTTKPEYVLFNRPWSLQKQRASLGGAAIIASGTATAPVEILQVHDIAVRQLGSEGYETRTYPAWTTANAGGNLTTAVAGERFSLDGMTWAKLDPSQLESWNVRQVTDALADSFNVSIFSDGADGLAEQQWKGLPITIDTRVVSPDGTSAWKRKMAGHIVRGAPHGAQGADRRVVISGIGLAYRKMGVYIERAWRGEDSGTGTVGLGVDFIVASATHPTKLGIINEIVEIADAIHGSPLGLTDTLIRNFDLVPADVGTAGEALLPFMAQIIDTMALEFFCDYEPSGTGRYGRLRVHAATIGSGTPDYTVPTHLSGGVVEDDDEGPGQAHYRQNLQVADLNGFFNAWHLPMPGIFPAAPYPANARVLSDSIAFSKNIQATAIQSLKDKDNATITGGIAQHRYRYENSFRRKASVSLATQDWVEPSDELEFPGLAGALDGETWIVSSVSFSASGGELTTAVECRTGDWYTAVRRAG